MNYSNFIYFIFISMSVQVLKKSSHKGPRQRFLNQTAFDPNRHRKSDAIRFSPEEATVQCCLRCSECIAWKIKYGKYKPLKEYAHCRRCKQRTISHAYHNICLPCTGTLRCCAKCEKEIRLSNAASHAAYEVPCIGNESTVREARNEMTAMQATKDPNENSRLACKESIYHVMVPWTIFEFS